MTSKEDDTLPLPGFSQELSTEASVDEDFIPTTQPESSDCSKTSKNSETKCTKSTEEKKSPQAHCSIEGLLSPEDRMEKPTHDQDKSLDFIPDTDNKQTSISYAIEDISCKKKLPVFNAEDTANDQENTWNSDISRLAESSAVDTKSFSILSDSPPKMPLANVDNDVDIKREIHITEIIVNDSADTVYLEQTPESGKKSQNEKVEEKLEGSCSLNSDVEKCEETQLFDYSSVLLLDQPGSEKSERFSGSTPEKSYLQETLDDNLQNVEVLNAESSSTVSELSKKENQEALPKVNGNISPNKEDQYNSSIAAQSNSQIVCRVLRLKLSVNCCITLNTKTNNILQKRIIDVEEIQKSKPNSGFDCVSDCTSDKSKRHSTSSSGSVYSDKTGLPFALPKRVSAISAISDQTDSSEDDIAAIRREEQRKLHRIPWVNEYLLPLKMDDLMQISIENQDLLKRRPKNRLDDKVNQLKQIPESSSSETSTSNLETGELQTIKTHTSKERKQKGEGESSTPTFAAENRQSRQDLKTNEGNKTDADVENVQGSYTEEEPSEEPEELKSTKETRQSERLTAVDEKEPSIVFFEGLPVLARWTDKWYYSGVLSGSPKNDRWEVKFDDGAIKSMRDDFIIPVEWLKVGALVFALTGDEYESGQIVDVKEGRKENSYVVELDNEKKKVSVKVSDLRMTEVMASIIKEKYKPVCCTPKGKSDIDCDNVLSGKRLREQKTPLRARDTLERESPGGYSKKKTSSKVKKDNGRSLEEISETPLKRTERAKRGLQSESGHFVEGKGISADSSSENETTETPLRGTSKEPRLKAKPKSLSYDLGETHSGKKTTRSYLRSDGTPIPGTSGVKLKKQKVNSKTNKSECSVPGSGVKSSSKKNPDSSKASLSTERGRRKRKLEESFENSAKNMALKDGSSKPKRKVKNY